MGLTVVKFQHLFLSPFVILSIPAAALSGQPLALSVAVAAVGLSGMIFKKQILASTGSISLLVLIVWGKASASLIQTAAPDTALLLVQFTAVLVFMEASSVTFSFEEQYTRLKPKEDELTETLRTQLQSWLLSQFRNQGKLAVMSLALSIILLPIAGITSITSNQLVFSATLALVAVIVLLFLVTHRRESEPP